jgi:hypothetical protein
MAQTFAISKKPSSPGTRKHRSPLVVSAQSKTPITVTPTPLEGKATNNKDKAKNNNNKSGLDKDKEIPHLTPIPTPTATTATPLVEAPPPVPASAPAAVRGRGRPKKALPPIYKGDTPPEEAAASHVALKAPTPGRKKTAKLKRTRQHRIDHGRLLEAERLSGTKVPLAASRIVEQLQALLTRATVEAFRGKRNRPHVTLSKLEEQAIQEALVLFQLKVRLQRGGEVRRVKVS